MAQRIQVITTGPTGAPYYNNFHTQTDGDVEADLLLATIENFYVAIDGLLTNTALVQCNGQVETFNEATGQTTSVYSGSPWLLNGTHGTSHAPMGTCLVVRWNTLLYTGGRQLRGRSFISGLGDIGAANGQVASGDRAVVQAAADAVVAADTLATYSPTHGVVVTNNNASV